MSALACIGLTNAIASATLALIVWFRAPRRDLARAYSFTNLAVAWWAYFFFLWQLQTTAEASDWPMRLLITGGVCVNLGFLFTAFTLAGSAQRFRKWLFLAIGMSVIFIGIILTGHLYGPFSPAYGLGYWPSANRWTIAYLIFWHAEVLVGFGVLLCARRSAAGVLKGQLLYFLAGSSLGYLGGFSTWPIWFRIYFPPHLTVLVSLYLAIVAYAIVKHHLLDINVVIRKTLLYSMVTAGLASVYAGLVTLMARLFENGRAITGILPVEIFHWFVDNLKLSFAYSCVATSLFSIGFSAFVWLKGRDKAVNRMWSLACLSIGAWSLGLGMMVRAPGWQNALLWERWIQYPGAIIIPIFFLHFVMLFLNIRQHAVLALGYAMAGFLEILDVAGKLVSIRIQPPFNYYTLPLSHYWIFVVYFFALVFYAHILLIWKMHKAEGRLKNQASYIFLGTSIGFCGGSTTFLPVFGIPIFPFGDYAVPLYIVIVSYAIFKHQLMDINVVIRKTLLYSLVSAALAAVYVGTITLLAHVLEGRHGPASALASALAAVFITLLFNPLRIRLQAFIDNKFARSRLVDSTELMQFSSEVIGHERLGKIVQSMGRILDEALRPEFWGLYLRSADDKQYVKLASTRGDSLPGSMPLANAWADMLLRGENEMRSDDIVAAVPLQGGQDLLGYLLLGEKLSEEAYSEEDLILLRLIANQAAVAFERPKMARQISGAFVHEVKMPLANISLPAELTFMEMEDAEKGLKSIQELLPGMKRRMKYIMEQASLAARRVDAVRDFSDDESEEDGPVDLCAVIHAALSSMDELLKKAQVEIRLDLNGAGPVQGSARQLEIVFVNLIKNAVEALSGLPEGRAREVRFTLAVQEDVVQVHVADTGPGIRPEDRDRIFQPHYTTKASQGGTGMGLFLCRQIVRAHGGAISVSENDCGGATFMIRLPAAN